ncbi:hypothetical protein HAX54_037520, partial [Datura stramonium]|nr:hypothetical protein [Datura stramonium]
ESSPGISSFLVWLSELLCILQVIFPQVLGGLDFGRPEIGMLTDELVYNLNGEKYEIEQEHGNRVDDRHSTGGHRRLETGTADEHRKTAGTNAEVIRNLLPGVVTNRRSANQHW